MIEACTYLLSFYWIDNDFVNEGLQDYNALTTREIW